MKALLLAVFIGAMILHTSSGSGQSIAEKKNSVKVFIETYHNISGRLFSYYVTRDSIRIVAVCGDVGCSEKVIYKQELTEIVADKFSAFLTELRLDTLENRYSTMALDGLTRSVSVQLSDGGELKQIVLHNFYHPTIAMLVLETEGLITDEKFKNLK